MRWNLVPILGTTGFGSRVREPDIHEVVNRSDLLNRVNRRPKKTDRY